jgi:hypothetical protein
MASYDKNYGGLIWTNHALERLGQRFLPQSMALDTYNSPDRYFAGKKHGTTECRKRFDKYQVTVITTKTEKGETLVLSCWVDPPYYGTQDYYKKQKYTEYKKATFWGRVWIELKSIVGL